MSNFFAPDSHLYQALSWIATLFVVNIAAVIGFAALITGGISWLVLFGAATLLITDGDVSAAQLWVSVRRNWAVATVIWLADLCFLLLLWWEALILTKVASPIWRLAWGTLLCLGFLVGLLVNLWIWPLLARQKVPWSELLTRIRQALWLSVQHLPRSFVGVTLTVAIPLLVALCHACFWKVTAWILLFGLAFAVYLVVLAQKAPLDKFLESEAS